jgi:excisionase family DNA binding protein
MTLEQQLEAAAARGAELGARLALEQFVTTLETRIQPELLKTMTLSEVAEFLKISDATCREEVRSGRLPAFEVGARGQWRIPMWKLVQYLDGQ